MSKPRGHLAKRTDRVSTPQRTDVLQTQYGDPLGDGWSTARIVSVVVPILLVVAVIAYFSYLWVARRDLVRAERERIDRRWDVSGGTQYRKKGRRGGIPPHHPDQSDDEDLYAPGYRPDVNSLSSGPQQGSSDSHTLAGSPEPSKLNDSPQPGQTRSGYSNLRAAESTYTLSDQPMQQYQRR